MACSSSLKKEAERAVRRAPFAMLSPEQQLRFNEVYTEGIRQRLRGDNAAAYFLMDEALRLAPNAPEALYEMSVLVRESAVSWEDSAIVVRADSLLERAAALMPTNRTLLLALADRLTEREDFRNAIYYREKAQELRPSDEQNLYVLTSLYQMAQDNAGAIATLDRLERLYGATEQIALKKFELYAEMSDSARAFQALEDLCAQYPADLRYRVILGDAYARVGRGEMAQYIYNDVLTTEPNNGFAQLSLLNQAQVDGNDSLYRTMLRRLVLNPQADDEARLEALRGFAAEHIRGDSAEVLRLMQEVLALPQSNRSFGELTVAYMMQRNVAKGELIPVLQQLLRIAPEHKETRFQLLRLYLEELDVARVQEICTDGLRYDPTEPAFYYYSALAYLDGKKTKEALRVLQQGTQAVTPKADLGQVGELFSMKADLLHQMGHTEEAYAAYDSVILYDSGNLLARNNYAYFLAEDGRRLDYAEKLSRRTIEAEPQNATFLDTYAWIRYRMRDYEVARTYIDSTLANDDAPSATVLEHAGDIYFRCGSQREALAFWQRALTLSPSKAERARIMRKVRRRRL